jgi:CubicO group peptidase (beta-lactamase class C family)
MHISARDMARFGYLFLNDGVWDGERIISEEWIEMARTPGPANAGYGFMNWMLNTERQDSRGETTRRVPQAPDAVWFSGAGSNLIFLDRDSDIVIVVRWISGGSNQFFGMVLDSIRGD